MLPQNFAHNFIQHMALRQGPIWHTELAGSTEWNS